MKSKTKRGRTQSAASVNRYLQVLASIFTLAEEKKKLNRDQRPKIETLNERNIQIRYLTTDEERRLLEAAEGWDYLRDIIAVGLATGLRREEIFGLRAGDLDFNLNIVTVTGKGGKMRRVPLATNSDARSILMRRAGEETSGWIF